MDIISTFNPPRLIGLGGKDVWARTLTVGDFAVIIAWLDDALPGREERIMPPKFLSDEAQAMLNTPLGWCVFAGAGLRHSGLTWDQVSKLILVTLTEGYPDGALERARLASVLFRRRKTIVPSGSSEDLGEAWWGPMVESMCSGLQVGIDEVASMTLDQVDCLGGKGLPNENPGYVEEQEISIEEMQARWEAAQAGNGAVI